MSGRIVKMSMIYRLSDEKLAGSNEQFAKSLFGCGIGLMKEGSGGAVVFRGG